MAHAQPETERTTPSVETPRAPPEASLRDQCLAHRKALTAKAQATTDLNERARLLRTLPDSGHASSPPSPAMTPADVVATEPPDMIAVGFVVEARIDTAYAVFDDTFTPGTAPGIFLGYRGSAFSAGLGLGLELVRIAESASSAGVDTHASQTAFLALPGVRIRMARTAEGNTELLAVLDAGIGSSWISDSNPSDDPASPVRLRFQLGLSPRHWFTRSFALGASIGLRYEIALISTEIAGMTVDRSASATSMFSSLQAIAVF